MEQPHETWRDQCAAAMTIQEKYGIEKAVGFLVGGAHLHHAEARSHFARGA